MAVCFFQYKCPCLYHRPAWYHVVLFVHMYVVLLQKTNSTDYWPGMPNTSLMVFLPFFHVIWYNFFLNFHVNRKQFWSQKKREFYILQVKRRVNATLFFPLDWFFFFFHQSLCIITFLGRWEILKAMTSLRLWKKVHLHS